MKNLLSVPDIARETGHNKVSVYQALERFKIEPEVEVGRFRFYHHSVVATLKGLMRRPKGASRAA